MTDTRNPTDIASLAVWLRRFSLSCQPGGQLKVRQVKRKRLQAIAAILVEQHDEIEALRHDIGRHVAALASEVNPAQDAPLDELISLLQEYAHSLGPAKCSLAMYRAADALVTQRARIVELERSVERGYQQLEIHGVTRERAKSIGNGIEVLTTRMRKENQAQAAGIAVLESRIVELERERDERKETSWRIRQAETYLAIESVLDRILNAWDHHYPVGTGVGPLQSAIDNARTFRQRN